MSSGCKRLVFIAYTVENAEINILSKKWTMNLNFYFDERTWVMSYMGIMIQSVHAVLLKNHPYEVFITFIQYRTRG